MQYPWWYVPILTSPLVIAAVSVIHVLVSHYAVGGGLLLARENAYAVKTGDEEYRKYWKSHTKFFVLLTVVFGAITGVGIWWTIGLASPLATQALIQTFVFGWAIEWVFFVIELAAAFAFYYYWDKLAKRDHVLIGWAYALAAWISLVLITGITAYMINAKGLFGDYAQTGNFWHAFFNVEFLPQMIARTGAALLLGTLYIFVHASWTIKDNDALKTKVVRRMIAPSIVGALFLLGGMVASVALFPQNALMAIERAAALNIMLALTAGSLGLLAVMIVFFVFPKPQTLTPQFSLCLLFIAFAAFACSEFIREAARKPYIVDGQILGNQIAVSQIADCQKDGFLSQGVWTSKYIQTKDANPGLALFMHHCNDCHASDMGLSALSLLTYGETKEQIAEKIKHLDKPNVSMPPWCGTDEEADQLAEYLVSIQRKEGEKQAN